MHSIRCVRFCCSVWTHLCRGRWARLVGAHKDAVCCRDFEGSNTRACCPCVAGNVCHGDFELLGVARPSAGHGSAKAGAKCQEGGDFSSVGHGWRVGGNVEVDGKRVANTQAWAGGEGVVGIRCDEGGNGWSRVCSPVYEGGQPNR